MLTTSAWPWHLKEVLCLTKELQLVKDQVLWHKTQWFTISPQLKAHKKSNFRHSRVKKCKPMNSCAKNN